MNREVLFRALCTTSRTWVFGYFCKDYTGTAYITTIDGVNTSVVDADTLGQFTGVIEKGRYRIYEGDILQYPNPEYKGVVKFGQYEWDNGADVYLYGNGFYSEIALQSIIEPLHGKDFSRCAVIGNIHENQELLEGSKP